MDEKEIAAEIADLRRTINELEEDARTLGKELAPAKRRRNEIDRKIKETYRYTQDDDGKITILGFRGEVKTAQSTRAIFLRREEDKNIYGYQEVEAKVRVSDPASTDQRALSYEERMRISDHYGYQFERERRYWADIEAARRTIDRLEKTRDNARKKTDKPKKDDQGTLL